MYDEIPSEAIKVAKGNRKAANKDVLNTEVVPIDWQALDNSNLNVINRVGIWRNKQVGCK